MRPVYFCTTSKEDMETRGAARAFLFFFLSLPVVQSEWDVTYLSTEICVPRGSTVDMNCTYSYPSHVVEVTRAFWFTYPDGHPDVMTDPDYTGRVLYFGDERRSALRITKMRDSDSKTYKFRFFTRQPDDKYTGEPGVSLHVTALQMQVTRVNVSQSSTEADLCCQSSCSDPTYVWFKNGRKVPEETSFYTGHFNPGDSICCALKGLEDYRTAPLYAPKLPSVSVSPSGGIVEGSSVNLTCSSDANIVANYTWFKKSLSPNHECLSEEAQLVFSSIQSSDSGEYYCTAENELGRRTSQYVSVNVKYAPKIPSVSLSPSGQIVEGSSVNLTCSSDANPAAIYTWYKENQTVLQGPEGVHHFTSISSEDRGIYCCKSENQYGWIISTFLFLDVQYAPKHPFVSLSPSGHIVEGSSVTLTCSSDANPAAIYTWYKEREESPKASGQVFTISSFTAEHSGIYYCEVQNSRGRHHSLVLLALGPEKRRFIFAGVFSALLIIAIFTAIVLWVRYKRTPKKPSEPAETPESAQIQAAEQKENLHYASVQFSKKRADPLYSNISPVLVHKVEEVQEKVEYATLKLPCSPE